MTRPQRTGREDDGWGAVAVVALVVAASAVAVAVAVMGGDLVVPAGAVIPPLLALPLLGAALVWRARAVAALAALAILTTVAAGVHATAHGVPAAVAAVGLAAVGALAVRAAALRGAVRDAERARDEFVGMVVHDLKNPLTAVRGQAQLLYRRAARLTGAAPHAPNTPDAAGAPAAPAAPDALAPALADLATGAARLDTAAVRAIALLNELLDAVQLRAGQPLKLVRRPIDLVALARQVAETYQATTEQHRLVVRAAASALVGEWDSFRLERVLENLLSNALKYSPGGGEITITVDREAAADGAWAVLAVRDPGMGIPAADRRRVFGGYHRGRNVVGMVPGTGIGLAGARRIVEQHGGTIRVDSVEGAGSTFTVRLPLPLA